MAYLGKNKSSACRTGGVEYRRFAGYARAFTPHVHDYPVVGLIRQGTRRLECNDIICELHAGQLFVANADVPHGCIQTGNEALVYESLALIDYPDCPVLRGPVVDDFATIDAFEEAVRAVTNKKTDAIILDESICALVSLLALDDGIDDSAGKPEGTSTEDIRRQTAKQATRFIEEHCTEPLTLEAIARACGRSRFGLIRDFTATFGLTPMRYLTSQRVELARRLLAAGQPCSQVAQAAGFADQAHLTRAFRDRIGLTPAFYQRAIASSTADSPLDFNLQPSPEQSPNP